MRTFLELRVREWGIVVEPEMGCLLRLGTWNMIWDDVLEITFRIGVEDLRLQVRDRRLEAKELKKLTGWIQLEIL